MFLKFNDALKAAPNDKVSTDQTFLLFRNGLRDTHSYYYEANVCGFGVREVNFRNFS